MTKLRVVVVGLGFGRWLIENELLSGLAAQHLELVGVCDLNNTLADEIAGKYSVRRFDSLDDVLADPEVDAVVLMTGPSGRADLVARAVRAGKPVMTTKPFETSSKATLEVLTLAKQAGVPVYMNSPSPIPEPDLAKISEWIQQFELGRVISYHGSTWCSYRETVDGSWYDNPELAPAAPITRLGIYLIADICRLMAPIENVDVAQSRIFTERPTSDNAVILLSHSDGTLGSIAASFCVDDGEPYKLSLEINFERGTIARNLGPGVADDVALQLSTVINGKKHIETASLPRSSGYQWELFARACRGEQVGETVAPEVVEQVVSVLERMRESQIV
jgi:predicted dehydrogenase